MSRHIAFVLAAVALATPAFAQIEDSGERNKTFVEARGNVRPVRLPPGGPTPRMSDGKPDLSGVWFSGPTGRANAWSIVPDEPRKEDPVPFKPEVKAKLDAMTRAELSSAARRSRAGRSGCLGCGLTIRTRISS